MDQNDIKQSEVKQNETKQDEKFGKDNVKSFFLALVIVIGAAVLCFVILNLLSFPPQLSAAISGLFLGAISQVHQMLKKHSKRFQFSTEPTTLVPLPEYGLPQRLLYVYATLRYLAITLLGGFLISQILSTVEIIGTVGYKEVSFNANLIRLTLFNAFVIFFLGQWIGVRTSVSYNKGIGVVLALVGTVVVLDLLLSLFETKENFASIYGQDFVLSGYWRILLNFMLFSACGIIGFQRGNKRRIDSYFCFLFKKLSKDTRNSLINLIYDEAQERRAIPR